MKALTKEPLIHFLAIALLIYMLQAIVNSDKDQKKPIIISTKDMTLSWESAWKRAPTDAELESLIAKKAQDEMLFEEALAMGLPSEDSVIYDKLVSRARHLIENGRLPQDIDEKSLRAYYDAHLDDYRKGGRFSFSHLFISIEHQDPIKKAEEMLDLLLQNGVKAEDIDTYGDDFTPTHIKDADKEKVSNIFGEGFYKRLSLLKTGQWQKYIISTKGVHLVYITAHDGGELLPFEEVKEIVKYDYIMSVKREHYQKSLKQMAEKYRLIKE